VDGRRSMGSAAGSDRRTRRLTPMKGVKRSFAPQRTRAAELTCQREKRSEESKLFNEIFADGAAAAD
jgi:hypothetical protein